MLAYSFYHQNWKMSSPFFQRPMLDLTSQYTFLKQKKKNSDDPLASFSRQLARSKENKLPKITTRHANTARKLEDEVNSLKLLLLARERRQQQILSQQRFQPNLPTFVMQMPMGAYYLPQQPQQPSPVQPETQKPQKEPSKANEDKKEKEEKEEEIQERGDKKVNKFESKSKLNRFRICAYAVYFSIYIKYFSKKFTENRKNWFDERYAINNGKVVFDGSANILRALYQLDVYKMIQDANKKSQLLDSSTSISKDRDHKSTFIGGTANFTLIILDFLSQMMTSQKFIEENHEVFTVGVLNQNFMITNLYLPQQADILHIHPAGYIQVDEETEILMLMIKIIVKITVYNFLLSLRFSRKWNLKQQKSYNLDHAEMEEIWEVTRTAAILFLISCEQIYDATVSKINYDCNFSEMAPRLGIVAAKQLQEVRDGQNNSNTSPSQELQPIGSKFIKNLSKYSEVAAMIAKVPYLQKFKDKLKIRIIDFLTEVYTCLKYEEYYVYDFIRDMTINQKYLILQGKKKELDEKAKNKKKKKNKRESLTKNSQKNVSFFGTMAAKDKESRRNSRWSQMPEENQGIKNSALSSFQNPSAIDEANEYASENQDSDEDEEGKQQGKLMKYRHEQLFYDRKFRGHSKLEKLKGRMKAIKIKKAI